ncbi:MAG TPA: WD40 repeat domain-containing protein [Candidatus Nanopusillus sp.]|nr:WD40 repeat domain-containing protein [Candidatus Nanopusillus sp.]
MTVHLNTIWENKKSYWSGVSGVAFSPDGKYLAIVCWHKCVVELMSVKDRTKIWMKTLKSQRIIDSCTIAYSPDGKYLAIASETNEDAIRVLNAANGGELWKNGDITAVGDVAFSPDGKYLAVTYPNEGIVRLLNTADGTEVWKVGRPDLRDACSIDYSPDGKYIVVSCKGINAVELISADDGSNVWIKGKSSYLESPYIVAFYPNGKHIAVVNKYVEYTYIIELLNSKNGSSVWRKTIITHNYSQ